MRPKLGITWRIWPRLGGRLNIVYRRSLTVSAAWQMQSSMGRWECECWLHVVASLRDAEASLGETRLRLGRTRVWDYSDCLHRLIRCAMKSIWLWWMLGRG